MVESLSAVAVMVTVPFLIAVTTPLASTVAIVLSEEVHKTLVLSALAGATVAVKVSVPPTLSSEVVLFNSTLSTFTG